MNRFHVNLTVKDLARSVEFYSQLFNAGPTTRKIDYAKWMLEDPRINFSISTHGADYGVNHVGIQVDSEQELADQRTQLVKAENPIFDQADTNCCYAQSSKAWIRDPDGLAWEAFYTHGETSVYGDGTEEQMARHFESQDLPAETARQSRESGSCCQPGS